MDGKRWKIIIKKGNADTVFMRKDKDKEKESYNNTFVVLVNLTNKALPHQKLKLIMIILFHVA